MKILLLLLGIVAAILAASIEHDETSLTQEVVAAPARVVRSAEPGNKKKKSLKKGKGKNRKNKGNSPAQKVLFSWNISFFILIFGNRFFLF